MDGRYLSLLLGVIFFIFSQVPPEDLVGQGVKVCRVVQEPGQFVVVFPGAFTSSVCSGYLISESAFFARPQYFDRAVTVSLPSKSLFNGRGRLSTQQWVFKGEFPYLVGQRDNVSNGF